MGKRGGKAKGFVEWARRLRRRAEWLAVVLVLVRRIYVERILEGRVPVAEGVSR